MGLSLRKTALWVSSTWILCTLCGDTLLFVHKLARILMRWPWPYLSLHIFEQTNTFIIRLLNFRISTRTKRRLLKQDVWVYMKHYAMDMCRTIIAYRTNSYYVLTIVQYCIYLFCIPRYVWWKTSKTHEVSVYIITNCTIAILYSPVNMWHMCWVMCIYWTYVFYSVLSCELRLFATMVQKDVVPIILSWRNCMDSLVWAHMPFSFIACYASKWRYFSFSSQWLCFHKAQNKFELEISILFWLNSSFAIVYYLKKKKIRSLKTNWFVRRVKDNIHIFVRSEFNLNATLPAKIYTYAQFHACECELGSAILCYSNGVEPTVHVELRLSLCSTKNVIDFESIPLTL